VQFFYPDIEEMPLPDGHRFPGGKYRLLREKAIGTGILPADWLVSSPSIGIGDLERAHSSAYVSAVLQGTLTADAVRKIGLPWSETLVRRSRATVGGALAAARSALAHGLSGQLAGGTHHAHRDFGSGFCVFNDLAVTCLVLLETNVLQRIAIVDLDVHQGDGNSAILKGVPGMLVVSVQGARNFPFRRVPSDIDVELPDQTEDRAYLSALAEVLPAVEAHKPDLVLYLSGADPLLEDRLGRLALTAEGLAERDRMVFEMCRRRGFPVSIAIGGGYAQPIDVTVSAYAQTFRVAREVMRISS
jgi:acetoin utilization deacetylase AcuC-like enzyme